MAYESGSGTSTTYQPKLNYQDLIKILNKMTATPTYKTSGGTSTVSTRAGATGMSRPPAPKQPYKNANASAYLTQPKSINYHDLIMPPSGYRQPIAPGSGYSWLDGGAPPYANSGFRQPHPTSGLNPPAGTPMGMSWLDIVRENYPVNYQGVIHPSLQPSNKREGEPYYDTKWDSDNRLRRWFLEHMQEEELEPDVYYGGWGGYGGGGGGGGGGGKKYSEPEYTSPFDFFFNRLNWRI